MVRMTGVRMTVGRKLQISSLRRGAETPCNPGGGSPSMSTDRPRTTGPISTVRDQPRWHRHGGNAVHLKSATWAIALELIAPVPRGFRRAAPRRTFSYSADPEPIGVGP